MKASNEKYKTWQELDEAKTYEEWKKTHSKAAIKYGLFYSFIIIATFTLLRIVDKYIFDPLYSVDDFKKDFAIIFIGGLFGGVILAWNTNRIFRKKLDVEKTKQN